MDNHSFLEQLLFNGHSCLDSDGFCDGYFICCTSWYSGRNGGSCCTRWCEWHSDLFQNFDSSNLGDDSGCLDNDYDNGIKGVRYCARHD